MNQEQINEKLDASAPAKDWIEDFVKSDDARFDGKSKDERIMMALGAYYAAQKNESVEIDELSDDAHALSLMANYEKMRDKEDEVRERKRKVKHSSDRSTLSALEKELKKAEGSTKYAYSKYIAYRHKNAMYDSVNYAAQKNESVELEENAGYMETLHTKYKFLRRQADEAEEKYKKAKERNLDDDSLETYYTAVRTLNDRADDVYDAYVDARDKAKKNESVELEEAVDFRDMKNASLKQWLKRNDTADSVSGVFGAQILAAKREAKRRGIDFNEGSVSLNFDREGEIPVTEGKTTDCAIDDLEDAIEDQEAKKKREKAEGEDACKTEALDPVGKEDDDVDNDGDSDESDEYLKNRRKTVTKAIQKEEVEELEEYTAPQKTKSEKLAAIKDSRKELQDRIAKIRKDQAAANPQGARGDWLRIIDMHNADLKKLDAREKKIMKMTESYEVEELEEGVEEIKARVAKYSVGDKTNFGVIKSISSTSIEFKSKDLPVTKIAFNQRKMGSKDFVLDRLSRMNESFTEARDLKIAQLALRSDGSGKLEDFVKNYSVVGKSILQIKEEYAKFLASQA